jgi:predicted RNase H-like nuclease (RuvC/YqgF family)
MLEIIQPVAAEATATMKELENTTQNLSRITEEDSELNQALGQFKTFGEHLVDLTGQDSPLSHSLNNIEKISNDLSKNRNLEVTLQNFRESSEKLKSTMRELEPVGRNIAEFSETVKTQPWRLIWPSTKKSPEPSPKPTAGEATITVRKSTKARPSPSPGRSSRR